MGIVGSWFLTVENTHFLWDYIEIVQFALLVNIWNFRRCHVQNLTFQIHRIDPWLFDFYLFCLHFCFFALFVRLYPLYITVYFKHLLNNGIVILSKGSADDIFRAGGILHLRGTLNLSHYGVELRIFNSSDRPQHPDQVLSCLTLLNGLIRGIMVLLVAEQDVLQEWALTRQESCCDL